MFLKIIHIGIREYWRKQESGKVDKLDTFRSELYREMEDSQFLKQNNEKLRIL